MRCVTYRMVEGEACNITIHESFDEAWAVHIMMLGLGTAILDIFYDLEYTEHPLDC